MKKRKKAIVLGGLITLTITLSVISNIKKEKEEITNSDVVLSNSKIEWGIQRKGNHEQPDLGTKNKELITKYNGMATGNIDKKYIYLTFDNGYEAGYTDKILESLKNNNVKAAFFITAHYANTASELVQQMIDDGHIIGNHTVNHKSMPDLDEEKIRKEIMELHQAINEKFGYEMKYIRPPMGEFSQRTINITNMLGYKTVMWSFAYEDWNEEKQPSEEKAKKKIIENLHNGEIMLLHGNSKTNAYILDSVIKEAKSMGYEFKSLDEFEK